MRGYKMKTLDMNTIEFIRRRLYDAAFETKEFEEYKRWDSGLWVRYKLIETVIKEAELLCEVGE